jgi:gas vesicle protein
MARKEQVCLAGAVVGAAVGAALAYLYMTDEGADRRGQIARAVDRLSIDAEEAQRLWSRLSEVWTQFDADRQRPLRSRNWPPGGAA